MSIVPTVFRSRWGFFPCDYATYRRLKALHAVYQRAVRLAHAWERWRRKAPHNRVSRPRLRDEQGRTVGYADPVPLAEPPLCPVFSRKEPRHRFVDRKGGSPGETVLDVAVVTDDPGVASDYSAARRPAADPAAVRPLRCTLAVLEELYEKARAWLERQDAR
jgi:hypothetical protein